jgi:glycosyltransferase involved in cell wall biosynthesis
MEKIRVLHLIDSSGMYGAEKVVLTLLNNIKDSAYHQILGCIRESVDQEVELGLQAENLNIDVTYFTMKRGLNLKGIREINSFISNNSISILHSHGYKPNIFLGFYPHKNILKRTITTIHGWAKECADLKLTLYELLNLYAIKRFYRCVAVSKGVYDDMVKRNIPSDKISIIRNGIDVRQELQLSDRKKIREVFGIKDSEFVIGTAGRLVKEKGIDIFLQAAVHFLKYNNNALFLIAGEGPLFNELKSMIIRLGIRRNVRFTGYVDQIYDFLTMLDVFVLSSRTEGLPMVLLEAMNIGCPAICTNVGGITEVINDSTDGLLIQPDNPIALAENLIKLCSDQKLRQNLAEKGKFKVADRFSAEKMAEGYLALYDHIIKQQRG